MDWRAHYVDWVENVDHRQPMEQEIADGAERLRAGKFNIHFHVWTDEDVMEMIQFTRQVWDLDWSPRVFWRGHSFRKEVTVLLVRGG
jgi:hypothetical protein